MLQSQYDEGKMYEHNMCYTQSCAKCVRDTPICPNFRVKFLLFDSMNNHFIGKLPSMIDWGINIIKVPMMKIIEQWSLVIYTAIVDQFPFLAGCLDQNSIISLICSLFTIIILLLMAGFQLYTLAFPMLRQWVLCQTLLTIGWYASNQGR